MAKGPGLFRSGADALQLHWFISSFSFYNVSNRATFSASFGQTLFSKSVQAQLGVRATDAVLAAVVIGYEPESWN